MNIDQLAKVSGINIPTVPGNGSNKTTGFNQLFEEALNVLNDTGSALKEADQMALDFAMGKVDSIQDVMIAQEKANIALQYTIQLRDGFMDAYNEIMRMQI